MSSDSPLSPKGAPANSSGVVVPSAASAAAAAHANAAAAAAAAPGAQSLRPKQRERLIKLISGEVVEVRWSPLLFSFLFLCALGVDLEWC